MKTIKRAGALLIILSVILSMFTVAFATGETLYTTGNVNLRKGPGLGYQIIKTMAPNTKCTVVSTSTDKRGVKWYKVNVGSQVGYASAIYLSAEKNSTAALGTVYATGSVNLRQKANKSSLSLGYMPAGAKASYYKTSTDDRGVKWYLVRYAGVTAWVSSKYTTTKKPGSSSSSSTSSKYVIVATDGQSNIRKSASLSGSKVGVLPSGAKAKYLDSTKYDDRGVAWYKITYGGVTGWVSSKYTTKKKTN